MGYFDDIFASYRTQPQPQAGGIFSDLFDNYRAPGILSPEEEARKRKLKELKLAQQRGDEQWRGISGTIDDSPDSTLGAVGQAFGATAADIGRGVVGFGTGLQEGIGGLEQAAGEQFGWDALAERGRSIGEAGRRTNEMLAPSQMRPESLPRDLATMTISNAPQLGLAYLTGGAALPILGAQAGGQEYSQATAGGASPEAAGTSAMLVGAVEALTEMFGDVRLVKRLTGQMRVAKTAEEAIKNFLGDEALNSGQEMAADIGDRLARWISYSDKEFGPGWWKETLKSGAVGAILPVAAHASMAGPQIESRKAVEDAQWNRAFAQGVRPEGNMFRDIFQQYAKANPMPQPTPQAAPSDTIPGAPGPEAMAGLSAALRGGIEAGQIPGPASPFPIGAARIGEDAGNGFVYGPDGYRVRVSHISATSGVMLEKRSETGQASGFYVGNDGKLIDAESVNVADPQSLARIWKPSSPDQRSAAEEVLREAATMSRTDPRRGDVLGRLRGIVLGLQAGREAGQIISVQSSPKLAADMTREELMQALLTSKTGINSEVAFNERQSTQPHKAIIAVDMDDFGVTNKLHGHAVGDALLELQARAFQQAGFDGAYHLHGDEFMLGHDGPETDIGPKLDAAKAWAAANPLIVEKDGQQIAVSVSFGHGIGTDRLSADLALTESKARAKAERRAAERAGSAPFDPGAVPQAPGLGPVQAPQAPEVAPEASLAYLTRGITSKLAPPEEVKPMEKRKPTAWTGRMGADIPESYPNVNGIGPVHVTPVFTLVGEAEKTGNVSRYENRGFAMPQNEADAEGDGPSVEGEFKQAQRVYVQLKDSPLTTEIEERGYTGSGNEAEIKLNNGRSIRAKHYDYLKRKAPGARWVGQQGTSTVYIVDESDRVIGFFRTEDRAATAKANLEAATRERQPGEDMEEEVPEDTGERAPAWLEEHVPDEALGITPQGSRALLDGSKLRSFMQKWFTSKGVLSTEGRDIQERQKDTIGSGTLHHKNIADALRRAERGYLLKHRNVKPSEFREAVRDALRGSPARAGSPVLPAVMRQLVDRARKTIDVLSERNIQQVEKSNPELADVMRGNLGTYLNRAYAAFDDPKHLGKMRKSGMWDKLKVRIAALPEMEGKSNDEIEGFMESLARRKEDFFSGSGKGMGTIETGIYKKRQEIPQSIRQLMGEYTDPAVEFFQTAEKLQRNVSTMEMYSALKELGTREGWLSDVPLKGISSEIGGRAARSPIGGMFTTEDMQEMIDGTVDQSRKSLLGIFTGIIKVNKTVGSFQGQARNFESNALILLGGGNLGAKWLPWGWHSQGKLGYLKGIGAAQFRSGNRPLKAAKSGDLAAMTNDELKGSWGRAADLGVVGTGSVDLADIRAFLGESNKLSAPRGPLEATWGAAKKAYRLGDDIPRFIAWQSETAKILWHSPKVSVEQAEGQAASITRDIHPTEGRQARALKALRKTPLVGGFISFVSEIPRNAKNIAVIGVNEIREGKAEGNKRKMVVGAHRLTSLGTALVAPAAINMLIQAVRASGDGDDPDPEEAKWVRRFMPPWMQGSENNVLRILDGKALVLDASFMDPWATLKKPLLAAIRTGMRKDKGILDAAGAGVRQAAEPYAQEGLGLATLIDLSRNRNSRGREIVDPNAPLVIKAEKYGGHLLTAMEPGSMASARRIRKAAMGEIEPSGRGYSVPTELAAVFGPRFMWIDSRQGLKAAARDFLDGKRRASGALNEIERREGNISQHEIDLAQKTADAAFNAGATSLVEAVEAARGMGLDKKEIIQALREMRVSREDVGAALTGIAAIDRRRAAKLKSRR